ncbi:hypothetical protein CPB84DRAFT_105721 [Gymnopilus junonius]|uniref:Uncharacterized protein n=1 Tax=Gymnopilus junonius TaxID=109634 RepID=A0A9P5NTS6_GYMJU|nr:hypothetical protein CPB84DRAFT_105721 [Gymnopilus junonius]
MILPLVLSQFENLRHIVQLNLETIDLRVLPLGLSGVFLGLQLLGALINGIIGIQVEQQNEDGSINIEPVNVGTRREGMIHRLKSVPHTLGGFVIFGFMAARLAGCLTLLYLSGITPVQERKESHGKQFINCPEYWMTLTFAYTTLLAFATFYTQQKSNWTLRYLTLVLLSVLGVYAYRDIWPFATYHSEPRDKEEGVLLWAKLAVLTVTAVIIPLFIPHPYVPVDPKNPAPEPNPEQTASWISALTYSYLDPLIILASKVVHLSYEQLPPLADYDRAQYLTSHAFPYIDPFLGAKRRHLFFGLLQFSVRKFSEAFISIQIQFC